MTEDEDGAEDGEEFTRRCYDAAWQRTKVCDRHEDKILSKGTADGEQHELPQDRRIFISKTNKTKSLARCKQTK